MLTNDEIQTICKEKVVNSGDFETIEIVHGLSGKYVCIIIFASVFHQI